MGLTRRYIEAANYDGGQNARDVRWDDDPHGLGVRLYPSGRKSYVLSYRVKGRKVLMTLADANVLTIDQARKRAKAELATLENTSVDPLQTKRRQALEARTGGIEQMFRAYVADKKPKRPDTLMWLGDKFIFPVFGKRSWRELGRVDVRDWHRIIASPYNANRALQALRAAFYWRLWQEDDTAGDKQSKRDTRNPCAGIPLRDEKVRQVRLELSELPRLEKSIDSETNDPYVRAYFRFLMATGCRRSEAAKLKWAEVVLEGEHPTATFTDTKAGDDRKTPLSAFAVRLLRALPRIKDNPHVFVGRHARSHLVAPGKVWLRIRAAAGLPHLRIHDLRRSFGSWLGDAGFTSKQIGTVLGHKTDITSRVYMAIGQQSARAAVDAVQALMSNVQKSSPRRKSNVAPIKARHL